MFFCRLSGMIPLGAALLLALVAGCTLPATDATPPGPGGPPLTFPARESSLVSPADTVAPHVSPPRSQDEAEAASPLPALAGPTAQPAPVIPEEAAAAPPAATPPSAASEGEAGIASYYADRFNGRPTTTGAIYDPEKLTAAHQSLPFGTKVKVVNLSNGREVVVTVNDRCRKRKFPFIDLSRAAAKQLRFFGKGITKVRIIPLQANAGGATR